jgi:hypothetical protein
LNGAVIVRTATVWASTFFAVGFDVVVTELADLGFHTSVSQTEGPRKTRKMWRIWATSSTYLISTGTWFKVLVREVELFDAKGA